MLLNQRFRGFFVFILLCKIEQDNALIWGQKNNSMGEGMERKILLACNKKDNDVNGICCVKFHRGNLRRKKAMVKK
ncbi:hypothetical protein ACQKJC_06890 [Priestia koreensis]|uniref:hypothetical protein n=1 Tax=Priestia koreensis TaxID=284581 RepID=UPI003D004344